MNARKTKVICAMLNFSFLRFILLSIFAIGLLGCSEPQLRKSSNWMPTSVGGPIEIRRLPPADELAENYREWISSSDEPKVYLYEWIFSGSTNQEKFDFDVRRAESPMGRHLTTFASFIYRNPTNGEYQIEWMVSGRQNPDLIRLTHQDKKFLLSLIQTKDTPMPRLQIVAIEGIEHRGVLVAIKPENVP